MLNHKFYVFAVALTSSVSGSESFPYRKWDFWNIWEKQEWNRNILEMIDTVNITIKTV